MTSSTARTVAWTALAIAVAVAITWWTRSQALDLAYQVRAGDSMLSSGEVLRTDTFTYTVSGEPWLNQQWGAQVLFALVSRGGGWAALDLLRGLGVGVAVGATVAACRARGVSPSRAAALALAGWLVALPVMVQLRPQAIGVALFALAVWIVASRAEHPRRLWWIPAISLVWANVHGSFPLVLVLLGLAAVEDRKGSRDGLVRLGWVALASVAVTFLTPFGPRVWPYVLDLATDPVIADHVGEWGPPSLGSATGVLFLASLAVVAILLVWWRRAVRFPDLLGLVLFAAMGCVAVRAAVWWALVAPVILAGILARVDTGEERAGERLGRVAGALALGAGIVAVAMFVSGRGIDPATGGPAMLSFAPDRLVQALRSELPPDTHVFASQVHASWAEFAAPELRYAVDSRIELFPEDVWERYFAVSEARTGWEELLAGDDVRGLLLDPDQASGLLDVIGTDPSWRLVLEDEGGAVYVRDGAA